jgi:hypothetical protein
MGKDARSAVAVLPLIPCSSPAETTFCNRYCAALFPLDRRGGQHCEVLESQESGDSRELDMG